jgi:hypothetical protein
VQKRGVRRRQFWLAVTARLVREGLQQRQPQRPGAKTGFQVDVAGVLQAHKFAAPGARMGTGGAHQSKGVVVMAPQALPVARWRIAPAGNDDDRDHGVVMQRCVEVGRKRIVYFDI